MKKHRTTSPTIQVYEPDAFETLTNRIVVDKAKSRIRFSKGRAIYTPSPEYLEFKRSQKR